MRRYRLVIISILCSVGLTACGGDDPPPTGSNEETASAAAQVRSGLADVQAAADENARPGEDGRDPLMEASCKDVTDADMDRVEAEMKRMNQEFVVLTGADNQALACSRYRQRLGER